MGRYRERRLGSASCTGAIMILTYRRGVDTATEPEAIDLIRNTKYADAVIYGMTGPVQHATAWVHRKLPHMGTLPELVTLGEL